MQFFDASDISRLLDYPSLVRALFEAHKKSAPRMNHLVEDEPDGGENKFISLIAWAKDELIVTKLVGVFPNNTTLSPPQPSVQGVVVAFDAQTGAARFVADGAALTFCKTAADSALGSSLLSRQDAERLLVIGAGGLAPHIIKAHCSVRRAIRKVQVWNRTFGRAQQLADTMNIAGVSVEPVEDLDSAVASADIVSCVTMSDVPLVKGEFLKPGTHLDLVGAYRPDMRETDDAAMQRGRIFVDTRNGMEGAGDLFQPIQAGSLTWSAVEADLFDLCKNEALRRRSAEEITIFKNVGGAHLDLFAAQWLQRAAELSQVS